MNMIILDKPYVSEFLIETIKKNNFKVAKNSVAEKYFPVQDLIPIDKLDNSSIIYSNSENSISLLNSDLDITRMVNLSKDKALFRKILEPYYPNYFYKKINYAEISTIDAKELKFPLILKPNVGFLSFGVYPIYSIDEWNNVTAKIEDDIKKFENIFPKNVVNTSNFIIEQMIEGDEFAIDAYFNDKGKSVILNIFQHPFFNDSDVSDRAYYTSKEIIVKYLDRFKALLDNIACAGNYKNFPFHLELRVNNDEIIPIELNPMRFCGWCITDIAHYSWGINVYEYFFKNLEPDWETILKKADNDYFYFTIADIPSEIDNKQIKDIDYDKYLKNISNPMDVRKIDYKNNPIFAIVFAKTKNIEEIKNILNINMKQFIKF